MKKFAIVSALDRLEKGDSFDASEDWPRHVTIVPWVQIPKQNESMFFHKASSLAQDLSPSKIVGGDEAWFGPKRDTRVRLLGSVGLTYAYHRAALEMVESCGADTKALEFVGDHFVPHITYQDENGLEDGEVAQLEKLHIISGDIEGKRVVERALRFVRKR